MTKEQKKFLIDFLIDESNKLTSEFIKIEKHREYFMQDSEFLTNKENEKILNTAIENQRIKIKKINEIIEDLTHYD